MKNLSLVHKLFMLTGWLLLNMLIVGGFSYWTETRLSKSLEEISLVDLPATRLMGTADMMHDGLTGVAYRAVLVAEGSDQAARDSLMAQLEEMSKIFHDSIADLEALNLEPVVKEKIVQAKPLVERYVGTISQIARYATLGNKPEALALIPKMEEDFEKLEEALGAFSEDIESHAQVGSEKAIALGKQATFWGFMIILFGLLFGAGLSWFLIRGLVNSLRGSMAKLTNESAALRVVSASIERASATLSSSTQREAAAVQQTASSLQETSAMVKKTSDNAEHSHSATEQSARMAEEGLSQVQQMIEAMGRIDNSSEMIGKEIAESNQQISEIVKLINEIGAKTKVINDIVFQTKLLSFNASVEAARAGEHGKGFAVVAEEVGNLATMSGNAAREINEMLSTSISKVERIIEEMKSKVERMIDSSRTEVKSGNQIADRCDQTITKVASTVKDVNRRVSEITTAAQEQAAGVLEISKALNELDQVTHTNAQTATQASEMALELSSRSATLLEVVSSLQKLVEGESAAAAQPPAGHPASGWADQVAVKMQGFGPGSKSPEAKPDSRLKSLSRR